ncbi:hypothetical protein ACFLY0_01420 [Patescibacteria group bacterium]
MKHKIFLLIFVVPVLVLMSACVTVVDTRPSSDQRDQRKQQPRDNQYGLPKVPRQRVSGAEYNYAKDVSMRATLTDAKEILVKAGGIVITSAQVSKKLGGGLKPFSNKLPFTVESLMSCGRCVLFPTYPKFGIRGVETSINGMIKSPEAKQLFLGTWKKDSPWFKDISFAKEPLERGWHLIKLDGDSYGEKAGVLKEGLRDNEMFPKANTLFWLFMFLPPEHLEGRGFYTSDMFGSSDDFVHIGRPWRRNPEQSVGNIRIAPLHKAGLVVANGVGRLVEIKPARVRTKRSTGRRHRR